MKFNLVRKVYSLLIGFVLFMYVFSGIPNTLGLFSLTYIASALIILIALINAKSIIISKNIALFLAITIVSFVLSFFLITKGSTIIPIVGFLSINLNLIIWILILGSGTADYTNTLFDRHIKLIVFFAVISAVLGVYQTYVDPSILGFATNSIYGDIAALNTGKYVRRATGLFGSPQNYGVFVGISFVILLFRDESFNLRKSISLLILLVGIIVSGSRSASICIIIAILWYGFNVLKRMGINKNHLIIIFFCGFILVVGVIYYITNGSISTSSTVKRIVDFDILPALSVHFNIFRNMSIGQFFFGRGLGFMNWTAHQAVGADAYYLAFGVSYTSTESFLLFLLVQMGLLGDAGFMLLFISAFRRYMKVGRRDLYVALTCLLVNMLTTPSFSGMAISYSFWPLILYAFYMYNDPY